MTAHSVCSNGSSSAGDSGGVSVKVAVRTRPLNDLELQQRGGSIEVLSLDHQRRTVTVVPEARSFAYDHVFGPQSSQVDVYEELVVPLLDKFFDGYNATVLAYGQTSSGKTHTMGTGNAYDYGNDDVGIIPRAIFETFDRIFHAQQARSNTRFQVRVSFLEIYNEELIDLLAEAGMRTQVQIREDPRGNIYWTGVREVLVSSPDDVMRQLEWGSQQRQVGQTDMNEKSSRSHAIFSVSLRQDKNAGDAAGNSRLAVPRAGTPSGVQSRIGRRASSPLGPHRRAATEDSNSGSGEWTVVSSKFHFVDLAGSERLKRTNAIGNRAKEGISINAGLSALGNVISALGDPTKKGMHVPYRDSKLTRLLQDSLGGNSQTLMIACVSPAGSNMSETLNTLKYANRARNIKNAANKNEEMSNDVNWLQQQVIKLRNEVKAMRERGGASLPNSPDGYDDMGIRSRVSSPTPLRSTTPNPPGSPGPDSIPPAVVRKVQKMEAELTRVNKSYRHLLVKYEETSAELSDLRDEHCRIMGAIANGAQIGPDGNLIEGGARNKGRKVATSGEEALEKFNNPAFVAEVEPIIEEYEKVVTQLEEQLREERAARKQAEDELRLTSGRIRLSEEVQRRKMEEIAQLRDRIRILESIDGVPADLGSTPSDSRRSTPASSMASRSSFGRGTSGSSRATSVSEAPSGLERGGSRDLHDLTDLQANIRELEQHFEESMVSPPGASSNVVLDGCPNLNALSRLLENGLHAQ
ncbi:P-loop containing nucleoside triphosphate hydrolase protein [Thamnocephalis sphaerospora]|uniref:Kinesin-like protein n=1 Tax=Thamnocephalis sphaerospora TaxID=78915 RepID=A0A4P9XIQ3_9FUNG|nr:P-loop containing nucleoside triphosphate hydrolase protein [Thamnocephalis sphaerospora]|eukprot:RKP05587.1 P-loop containing nucleoside triphosphate hydrolase protein [Thamnocephalis sphaerospora]